MTSTLPSYYIDANSIAKQMESTNLVLYKHQFEQSGYLNFYSDGIEYRVHSEILAYSIICEPIIFEQRETKTFTLFPKEIQQAYRLIFSEFYLQGKKYFDERLDRLAFEILNPSQQADYFLKLKKEAKPYVIAKDKYPIILNEDSIKRYGKASGFYTQFSRFIDLHIGIIERHEKEVPVANTKTLKNLFENSSEYDKIIDLLTKEKLILEGESSFKWNGYKNTPSKELLYECVELKSIHALGINLKLKNYFKPKTTNTAIAKALSILFGINISISSFNTNSRELKEDSNSIYNKLFEIIPSNYQSL